MRPGVHALFRIEIAPQFAAYDLDDLRSASIKAVAAKFQSDPGEAKERGARQLRLKNDVYLEFIQYFVAEYAVSALRYGLISSVFLKSWTRKAASSWLQTTVAIY